MKRLWTWLRARFGASAAWCEVCRERPRLPGVTWCSPDCEDAIVERQAW